jgi:hypothetical protein
MDTQQKYIASKTIPGDTEFFREHAFTRWMSRDLLQAASDFCRNIGLYSIYSECSPDCLTRYLFWRMPQGALIEARSGRTEAQFREIDKVNIQRGLDLLSLHINESDIYSAVWISSSHLKTATAMLAIYGITTAQRPAEA